MFLLHGQSSIERGFSVNKEILNNKLQEKSLISQHLIYDHFPQRILCFMNMLYLKH